LSVSGFIAWAPGRGGGCYRADWLAGQFSHPAVSSAKIAFTTLLLREERIVSREDLSWWRGRAPRLAILALAIIGAAAVVTGCGGSDGNDSSEAQKQLEKGAEEVKKGLETAKKEVSKGFKEAGKAAKQGVENGKGEAQKAIESAKKEAEKRIEEGKDQANETIEEAEKQTGKYGY